MSIPLLSRLFSHFSSTRDDFPKLEKKPLESQLAKLASIGIYPNTNKGQFIYPIIDDSQVYVRLSTLLALREHCLRVLDTLPDKQEAVIRDFLNYFNETERSKSTPLHPRVTFLSPVALKPL